MDINPWRPFVIVKLRKGSFPALVLTFTSRVSIRSGAMSPILARLGSRAGWLGPAPCPASSTGCRLGPGPGTT